MIKIYFSLDNKNVNVHDTAIKKRNNLAFNFISSFLLSFVRDGIYTTMYNFVKYTLTVHITILILQYKFRLINYED